MTFFRIKEELYNIEEIHIKANFEEEVFREEFCLPDFVIKSLTERDIISEENLGNHGLIFDSIYDFSKNLEELNQTLTQYSFKLNIQESQNQCYELKNKEFHASYDN